jgi:outer membrane protein OmpA-like peptidoglycan-associated protein
MKLICTLVILLTGASLCCFSQAAFTPASKGYYTIVGAFAIRENAANFNASLRKSGIHASYGYLTSGHIYYVYTLKDQRASACLKEMHELRKKPGFSDAWVRYIDEDTGGGLAIRIEEEPVTRTKEPAPVIIAAANTSNAAPEAAGGNEEEKIILPDKVTLGNTEIFLSLYNARNDRVADGVVQVIDTDRGRLISEVKGNTYLILPDPKSKSGNVSLICDVVGYRKIQKEINFNEPLADTSFIEQMGTSIIAHFELVPYQRGDIRTLYNIYFYNDAAVMMPESKFELNGLEVMMKDNPKFHIRLHGHTNGNYHGKIIRRTADGDFFSVAQDAKTSVGSAKELSESSAEVIRDYLVSRGIDGTRIAIKAWGGKRPLFDKNSANAKKNIRVEVEIVKE